MRLARKLSRENMDGFSIQNRMKEWCRYSKQCAYLACLLLAGLTISPSAYSAERFFNSVNHGIFIGLNYGRANVDKDALSEFNSITGLSFSLSGFVEKPLSELVSLSAELHVASVVEMGKTSASSTGAMIALGGTLGRTASPRSPYLSASLGYSYVDIGESGEVRDTEVDTDCSVFIPFCNNPAPFRRSAHGKGIGYRIATG